MVNVLYKYEILLYYYCVRRNTHKGMNQCYMYTSHVYYSLSLRTQFSVRYMYGLFSLFLACFWGFHDVVKTLLDKGAGMVLY